MMTRGAKERTTTNEAGPFCDDDLRSCAVPCWRERCTAPAGEPTRGEQGGSVAQTNRSMNLFGARRRRRRPPSPTQPPPRSAEEINRQMDRNDPPPAPSPLVRQDSDRTAQLRQIMGVSSEVGTGVKVPGRGEEGPSDLRSPTATTHHLPSPSLPFPSRSRGPPSRPPAAMCRRRSITS